MTEHSLNHMSSNKSPHITAPAAKILLVDDDPVIRAVLREALINRGYQVSELETAQQVRNNLASADWDLIILDRRLPDCDGLVLLRTLLEHSKKPVIILSILGDDHDRVLGLELGASDYLAKPVNLDELCIRVRNTLAHSTASIPQVWDHTIFGDYTLNSTARTLSSASEQHRLTAAEAKRLECLVENAGQVFTREQLAHSVFNREWYPHDRTIDVLIGRLRKMIEKDPRNPQWIVTLHGEGYLFRELP